MAPQSLDYSASVVRDCCAVVGGATYNDYISRSTWAVDFAQMQEAHNPVVDDMSQAL